MDEIQATGTGAVGLERPGSSGHEMGSSEDKKVYIGKKELMSYVLAVVTQFNNNKAQEVHLKARGKLISRAVDVAEIVRNRFLPDVKVKNIEISTEELPSVDGRMSKVSSIEIILFK